jgi:hypothetical protein
MAKRWVKGIVKRERNGGEEVFVIERRKGRYTYPGKIIDEDKNNPDYGMRKRALNSAYRPFGIKINDIDGVYDPATRDVATSEYPEVELIFHEIADWERIRPPKKKPKSVKMGRVRWIPSEQAYSILDTF